MGPVRWALGTLLSLGPFLAAPVRAQESAAEVSDGQPTECGSSAVTGPADPEAPFVEFQCWFDASDYSRALKALERACTASSDDPACLFNRALVHHLLLEDPKEPAEEHCRISRANYADYLAGNPQGEQAAEVQNALVELAEICETAPAAAAPTPVAPAPPLSPRHDTNDRAPAPERPANPAPEPPVLRASSVLFATGVVTAAAAGVSLLHAWEKHQRLTRGDEGPAPTPLNQNLEKDQKDAGYLALGLGLTSAALVGTGIYFLVHESRLDGLSLDVAPGVARLGYRGDF